VLTEITQESEWDVATRAQFLESLRCSRTIRTLILGAGGPRFGDVLAQGHRRPPRKIDPLRKIALRNLPMPIQRIFVGTPGKREYSSRIAPLDRCRHLACSPRAVETRRRRNPLVGKRFAADHRAQTRSGDDVWASTLYILGRNAGSKTDAGKSISSAHCPTAAAPESGGASNSWNSAARCLMMEPTAGFWKTS